MATVYLAHDLKHNRDVALKFLHPELAARLGTERFLREIQLTARLRHPHILPLFESGEDEGQLWYAMPYVNGQTLRQRLVAEKQLPLEDAIRITRGVLSALAYAHKEGVLHRDIKPENVLLDQGEAVVADFGIAQAAGTAGGERLTGTGLTLGTPAYMSPEQAAGDRSLSPHSDIYSVGCVLYEMLAGEPPFSGPTPQAVIAKRLSQRPQPLRTVRDTVPDWLEEVVQRALATVPADRFATANAFAEALQTAPTSSTSRQTVTIATRFARWRTWVPAAVVLLASIAALAFYLSRPASEIRLGRRVQLTLDSGLEIEPALSPDGKLVAFAAGPIGQTRIYVRQVDGGAAVAISSGQVKFGRGPRWSPDGSRLVFRSDQGVVVIPALGGAPQVLVGDRPELYEGGWSPDGQSLVYVLGDSLLMRPVEGGTSRVLAQLAEAHSCAWSLDGRWVACVSGNREDALARGFGNIAASSVWVIPVAGGVPVRVTDDQSLNTSPVWVPGRNSLLFISNRDGGRDIYQVTLGSSGRPVGDAARLTTGLNATAVSVSADGRRLAYAIFTETSNVWGLPIPPSSVATVNDAEPVTTGTQVIESFDISRDATWIAFDSDRGGTQQLYRAPIAGGEVQKLTSSEGPTFGSVISPDGRAIAYHSFREGRRQVFVLPAEGGIPTQVTAGNEHHWNARWSPDGRRLAVDKGVPPREIEVVSREKDRWGAPRLLAMATSGVWLPDGDSVLAIVPSGDKVSLGVIPHSGGRARLVTPHLAAAPLFTFDLSEDGRFIYYIGQDPVDQIISVWRMPAVGGASRVIMRFDDPGRPWHRFGFQVRKERLYFTLGDQQSDIWMTEIEGSR
jgi:serine/threonine-protein kinase